MYIYIYTASIHYNQCVTVASVYFPSRQPPPSGLCKWPSASGACRQRPDWRSGAPTRGFVVASLQLCPWLPVITGDFYGFVHVYTLYKWA